MVYSDLEQSHSRETDNPYICRYLRLFLNLRPRCPVHKLPLLGPQASYNQPTHPLCCSTSELPKLLHITLLSFSLMHHLLTLHKTLIKISENGGENRHLIVVHALLVPPLQHWKFSRTKTDNFSRFFGTSEKENLSVEVTDCLQNTFF